MLQTHLHQESNLHGKQMLNKSELWDIPKAGEMKNATMLWIIIGQQEAWKIGKHSRAQLSP